VFDLLVHEVLLAVKTVGADVAQNADAVPGAGGAVAQSTMEHRVFAAMVFAATQ
jgi:hypothetical protein